MLVLRVLRVRVDGKVGLVARHARRWQCDRLLLLQLLLLLLLLLRYESIYLQILSAAVRTASGQHRYTYAVQLCLHQRSEPLAVNIPLPMLVSAVRTASGHTAITLLF